MTQRGSGAQGAACCLTGLGPQPLSRRFGLPINDGGEELVGGALLNPSGEGAQGLSTPSCNSNAIVNMKPPLFLAQTPPLGCRAAAGRGRGGSRLTPAIGLYTNIYVL